MYAAGSFILDADSGATTNASYRLCFGLALSITGIALVMMDI